MMDEKNETEAEVARREAKLIYDRLVPLFDARVNRTQYWLSVTNESFEGKINFFFNSKAARQRKRSIPLHSIESSYDNLVFLELVLHELRKKTLLTIDFLGFEDKRWPSDDSHIEQKRDHLET
ncbi:hypothetical protein [Secundilactobacillus malefermentans]|nr:hypothetical protein [Secundilactobacillus malefermentans]QEA32139.1 acetyl-CoA carboxylase [Secundilactobacillus malefermentans]